ncbi:MAG: hypothetical protein JKY31_04230 [Rhodobacteraceae bacterium]|nr:hypothetical protein [Paracoccaceae bacterium]
MGKTNNRSKINEDFNMERYEPIIDAEFIEVTESLATERNTPSVPAKANRKGPISPGALRA